LNGLVSPATPPHKASERVSSAKTLEFITLSRIAADFIAADPLDHPPAAAQNPRKIQ
jgi:hypothetical protein